MNADALLKKKEKTKKKKQLNRNVTIAAKFADDTDKKKNPTSAEKQKGKKSER